MSGLSRTQKEQAMKQFIGLTRATPADAARLCKKAGYRVDAAIEHFYSDYAAQKNAEKAASAAAKDAIGPKLETQFNSYRDVDNPSQTDIDGSLRVLNDLSLSPEDPAVLCLAHLVKAPRMGIFDKKGWIEGWKSALAGRVPSGGDVVGLQTNRLVELQRQLRTDAAYLVEVYRYTFDFGKDEGQKSFALESAIAFWEMLMPIAPQASAFPKQSLELWFDLLRSKNRAISRDTWNLFLDFVKDIDPLFKNHDEYAAWPSVIDDYVAFARGKLTASGAMDTS